MYENVHPNLALVLLFERTEVECGKGILFEKKKKKKNFSWWVQDGGQFEMYGINVAL